jgi:ABC-2 type transport system permease protein
MRKELSGYFSSLIGYLVMAVFLAMAGLFLWVFPQTNVLDYGYANIDPLFQLAPYIYLFLVPAITMRAFAEEKRAGTMELLLTKPLTDWDIVLGKFAACWLLVAFALLPTLLYYYTAYRLGAPEGNIDTAAVAGSYLGLLLLGAAFVAIGLLASSLTDNQIVAFIAAVFSCYLLYDGFASLAAVNLWAGYAYWITQAGIDFHYAALSRGLIDSKNIIYFASVTGFLLYLSRLSLASRRW